MLISILQKNHPNLTPAAIVLYLWIEEKCKKSGKNFLFYCLKDMSNDSGISDRKCRDLIKVLESEHLILIEKSGRSYRYSLPDSPKSPNPPKKRNKIPEKSAAKKSHKNKYIKNNIVNISDISDISANQNIVPLRSDPQSQPLPDPFATADISGFEADAEQVRLVWRSLATWRGKKSLYIGFDAGSRQKIPHDPAETRERMKALTPEQVAYVVRGYSEHSAQIKHKTAWIQSALYYSAERMAAEAAPPVAVGETHAPNAPVPVATAAKPKQRNKFCNFEQRTYDYDALERAFEAKLLAEFTRGGAAPSQGIAPDPPTG